ncbi:conserved hypothetical protein [Ricinus communis]|uniref:KNOX1 domain-containing protein n=1 Tax=Ricinus communis TaxID=3988 RepID=B9SNF2_RICCO|nr:conserved hypothetical protein [Ricinus communis]
MEAEGEIVMEVKSTENEKDCKNGSSRAAKEEEEEEEKEIQKRILGHPLYSLLVETHIDCLKEAYCVALNKLKEAMEESLQETAKFIKAMYNQLAEINDKDQ